MTNEDEEMQRSIALATNAVESVSNIIQMLNQDVTALGVFCAVMKAQFDAIWEQTKKNIPADQLGEIEKFIANTQNQMSEYIEIMKTAS